MSELKYTVGQMNNIMSSSLEYFTNWKEAEKEYKLLTARIAELEAENAELKERVAMLDVTAVYKSLGEMGYIEQVDKLNARIAELEKDVEYWRNRHGKLLEFAAGKEG